MSEILTLFAAFWCITLWNLFKYALHSYRQYQVIKDIPGPPIENIIFGNTTDIMTAPEDFPRLVRETGDAYGKITKIVALGLPIVFTARADYAEVFLNSKSSQSKSFVYSFLHVWLGTGLLNSNGEMWQKRRKLITPAFHFSILTASLDIFVSNTLTLIDKLRENSTGLPIEVFNMMHLVALDNICEAAMGIKIGALKNPNMRYIRAIEEATHTVQVRISRPWYWLDLLFFLMPIGRKFRKNLDTIFELTDKAIQNRREERAQRQKTTSQTKTEETEETSKKRLAFLDLLMEASKSEATPLSDKDIRDEVNTFMFEGHDTTAVSMSFTLWLIGLHPEVQEKCYDELENIFQGSDRRPTMDDVHNMRYLEQVIKESLRLLPSVPLISRQAADEIKLGKYTVPKGAILGLNLFNLHRDPTYFPDPEKFDPERFSPENTCNRHPYAFLPFAGGPRNCIGQKFAMMEEKVVISYILRNFILESTYGWEDLQLAFALIARSQKNLDVKFTPRKRFRQTVAESSC